MCYQLPDVGRPLGLASCVTLADGRSGQLEVVMRGDIVDVERTKDSNLC